MKNLYFQRSNETYLLIKENVETIEEALREITFFLERHNYISYYTRYWTNADETTFDVGSWSEFFKLAPADGRIAELVVGTEKNFVDKKVSRDDL
jgi:hypothetical protein